ncbi:SO_0444 family Cu/Zn efflux transporter [Sulfurimonas sp.]
MDYITLFFSALVELSHAMSPYILFGLIFAGILHEIVPESIVTKHLGSENIGSVIKATVFGIPLPVCSCGVIPLATSIKKSGASKGATLSFLISTPITGVDSILATYGMFGWIFTFYRIFTSMIIAMVAGVLTNYLDKELIQNFQEEKSCCSSTDSCSMKKEDKKKSFSFVRAMDYAFVTLLGDIAKPLLYGLLIGALITIAIPQNLSEILMQNAWFSYLIAIAIAVPMYVCATASLPIAAALMISGVSPGAAFVFLTAGPATNTVTIGVVKKMLGTMSLYIYLGTIILGSIVFGLGLDYIFDINSIDIKSMIHMSEEVGLIEVFSTTILWGLMIFFIFKSYFVKGVHEQ